MRLFEMIFQPPFNDIVLSKTAAGLWRLSNGADHVLYEGDLLGVTEIQLDPQQLLLIDATLLAEVARSALIVSGEGSIHVTDLNSSILNLDLSNFQVSGELTAGLVPLGSVELDPQTQLGHFRLLLENRDELTMTAAQANGRVVLRDRSMSTSNEEGMLSITDISDAPSADFSKIRTLIELSES